MDAARTPEHILRGYIVRVIVKVLAFGVAIIALLGWAAPNLINAHQTGALILALLAILVGLGLIVWAVFTLRDDHRRYLRLRLAADQEDHRS